MPELPEIEQYRQLAEQGALGRTIAAVDAPDSWYLKHGLDARSVAAALARRRFVTARRIGKLLLLDTSGHGPVLGLHFGMTGRLLVDGQAAIERLEYSSNRDVARWDRFVVHFADGGHLRMRDPRRLGRVDLDPDESHWGVDALDVTAKQLGSILGTSKAPLKARLMDQSRLAGLGNLLTDEILWRAGLDPARPAGSLDANERRKLHRHVHRTLEVLMGRGGSHTGDLHLARNPGAVCPRDGTPLVRQVIGGRRTYSCPAHQR